MRRWEDETEGLREDERNSLNTKLINKNEISGTN